VRLEFFAPLTGRNALSHNTTGIVLLPCADDWVSASVDRARTARFRNISCSGVGPLSCATFWCGRVACAGPSSSPRIVVAPSNCTPLWRDEIAANAEPKSVIRPIGMAARVVAHYNFAGCRNIPGGSVCRLTGTDLRRGFIARPA
jgi:hypothetical protein